MDKAQRRNTQELVINSKSSQPVNQGMQTAEHWTQPEITYNCFWKEKNTGLITKK
jgi:hypothetical protein